MAVNYQHILDETISALENTPTLLLHSCCAPCSSYVLEYLSAYFKITVLFYNPNISSQDEYIKRAEELKRLISLMKFKNPVKAEIMPYNPNDFSEIAKAREFDREGGDSCFKCYELRLKEAAKQAKEKGYDYFTTTLSISPLKNSQKLNEIGKALSDKFGVNYLFSDFKKKGGFKRSCALSEQYSLYRQNYCGCAFSKKEAELREKTSAEL